LCVNYPLDSLANSRDCGLTISESKDHDLYVKMSLEYSKLNEPVILFLFYFYFIFILNLIQNLILDVQQQ